MKRVVFAGENYEAERFVISHNTIIGYVGEHEVVSFRGISDFSKFSLEDAGEFDIPVPTLEEKLIALEQEKRTLQLALAESIEKQEMDKISNQLALAELIESLTIKGAL